MCRKKCKTVASRINRFTLRVNEDPAFSSCFPLLYRMYMMLLIHSGGNLCSRKCSLFCLKADAEPGWKSVLTERKQKTTKKNPLKLWKWLCTEAADDRRLSGNELLSCTRRIFRAPGKAETAHICARCVEGRTQCMCLNRCHKSMSAWQTWRHSEAYLLALRWHSGRWNQEKWPVFLSC